MVTAWTAASERVLQDGGWWWVAVGGGGEWRWVLLQGDGGGEWRWVLLLQDGDGGCLCKVRAPITIPIETVCKRVELRQSNRVSSLGCRG